MAIARGMKREPLPWQSEVYETAFEVDSAGVLWYREIVIIVPRQSGKTTLVIPWGVHRCIMWPSRQFMVYTAQTREAALEKMVEDQFWLINQSPFRQLIQPTRRGRIEPNLSHGAEHIRWKNGSKWSIDAPTEKAGHGKTLGLGIGDEVFAHKDARVEAAMSPAMITVPDSQKLWISTVGPSKAKSPFLWSKVEAGRNRIESGLESRTLYIEFSAEKDADWLDPLVWWATMPALGYTITQDKVAAEADSLGEEEFRRAYLNQWQDDLAKDWKIPAPKWNDVIDPESGISDTVVWCLDVNPERTHASISVASLRDDELIHIECIASEPGTDWAIPALVMLLAEHGGDLYVDRVTVGAIIPDLEDAGLYPIAISAEDAKLSAGALFDAVVNRTLRHLGQWEISDALAAAATRKFGDGWAWSRGPSMADITALVSVSIAHWMLKKTLPDLNYDPLAAMREANGGTSR